jgi:cell division ATP-binding protein FtsE
MIRFYHVFKEFPRTGMALSDVTFEIGKGEFCFLTGHSGAGKSTIMRLIHMAERPSRGDVRVSGYSGLTIRPRDVSMLRRKIGYVFQDFRLLQDRTAAENVAFALEVTGARRNVIQSKVGRLLAKVGLAAKSEAFPAELSGGEQQRVAIARALVTGNALLVADEPTGDLDFRTGVQILELLQAQSAAGRTVIVVTHNREISRIADRVVELSSGSVLSDGPPAGGQASTDDLRW